MLEQPFIFTLAYVEMKKGYYTEKYFERMAKRAMLLDSIWFDSILFES